MKTMKDGTSKKKDFLRTSRGCRLRFHCTRTAPDGSTDALDIITEKGENITEIHIGESRKTDRQTDVAVLLVEAVDLIDSLYLDTKRTLKVVAEFNISGKVKLKGKLFVN